MRQFGLIGRNIHYSFSEKYFAQKFDAEKIKDAEYKLYDLTQISEIENLFKQPDLVGLNVTIPYKREVIPFLDEIDGAAKEINAVNTILLKNGKKIGYNTDVLGFYHSLKPLLKPHHENALILGTGGASSAVAYILDQLNISYISVSRQNSENSIAYDQLNPEIINGHQIIINCTPLGTFPNIEAHPIIPYESITSHHLLYDLIYNPEETTFLKKGKKMGAITKNGLEMLVKQAEEAWKIWNNP